MRTRMLTGIFLILGLAMFFGANAFRKPVLLKALQPTVAMPVSLQLIGAFGDRYLAANIAVWRVLMTGGQKMTPEAFAVLAKVQEDASFLNPGHEDNYVTATATLPWEGFVAPTQTVLKRATEVRRKDVYAPFFYGFNQIHFLGDAKGAYEYGRIAVSYAQDEQTRQALTVISAAWLEKGNDPALAQKIIAGLANELRDPGLKAHLLQRAKRQEIVLELQRQVGLYARRRGALPTRLSQLTEAGLIDAIPEDPVGTVYFVLGKNGNVMFEPKKQTASTLR